MAKRRQSSGVTVEVTGSFKDLDRYLRRASAVEQTLYPILTHYGKEGVSVLQAATPIDSGKTAASWYYTVGRTADGLRLSWANSNEVNGTPVVIFIRYGHATRSGYWVEPNDFVTPALQPLLRDLSETIEREVGNL